MTVDWIAVDWGTSNIRAWGVDAAGRVLFTRSANEGMGRLTKDEYPRVLDALLSPDVSANIAPLDVLICGMAGAKQGWLEAPYLDVPADLRQLASHSVVPPTSSLTSARILPGLCQRQTGAEDVMRGEETQLLGLAALMPGFSGPVCMPGTHCKWVELNAHRVERFVTAMTGELFDVLSRHTVLRHSLGNERDGTDHAEGLDAGLAAGIAEPQKLTALLFKVRSGSLLSGRKPGWCAGFLSGLLVGADIGGQREWIGKAEIPIVGDPGLCQLYARGLRMVGALERIVDVTQVVLMGLRKARETQ